MDKEINAEMVLYRLDSIDKAIAEFKEDLKEIKEDQKMFSLQKYQVEEVSTKVTACQIELAAHEAKIRDLQQAPDKAKAKRFQEIVDTSFKLVIELALVGILIKLGLK